MTEAIFALLISPFIGGLLIYLLVIMADAFFGFVTNVGN